MNRYEAALHRMQSAIALDMTKLGLDSDGLIPIEQRDLVRYLKHLRVGINSAMAPQEGLATLLIEKGLFTLSEYETAMTGAAEREADRVVDKCIRDHDLPAGTNFA